MTEGNRKDKITPAILDIFAKDRNKTFKKSMTDWNCLKNKIIIRLDKNSSFVYLFVKFRNIRRNMGKIGSLEAISSGPREPGGSYISLILNKFLITPKKKKRGNDYHKINFSSIKNLNAMGISSEFKKTTDRNSIYVREDSMVGGVSRLILFAIIVLLLSSTTFGQSIKFIEETPIEPGLRDPGSIVDFCVHRGRIFIPDQEDEAVKIYEKTKDGNLYLQIDEVRIKEFRDPAICYANDQHLVVLDLASRKIFVFNVEKNFKLEKTFLCPHLGYDLKVYNNKIFISGYIEDQYKYPYELYSIDLSNDQMNYFLRAHIKYGISSHKQYLTEYSTNPNFGIIGLQGWFDINKKGIFYSWEANMEIIKIDLTNGPMKPEIVRNIAPSYYKKPHASQKLRESMFSAIPKAIEKERKKMTYIQNIFATDAGIILISEGPNKKEANINLHVFNYDGTLRYRKNLKNNPGAVIFIDEEGKNLFSYREAPESMIKFKLLQ